MKLHLRQQKQSTNEQKNCIARRPGIRNSHLGCTLSIDHTSTFKRHCWVLTDVIEIECGISLAAVFTVNGQQVNTLFECSPVSRYFLDSNCLVLLRLCMTLLKPRRQHSQGCYWTALAGTSGSSLVLSQTLEPFWLSHVRSVWANKGVLLLIRSCESYTCASFSCSYTPCTSRQHQLHNTAREWKTLIRLHRALSLEVS